MTDNLHNYIREDAETELNTLIKKIIGQANGQKPCIDSYINVMVKSAASLGAMYQIDMQRVFIRAIGDMPVVKMAYNDEEMERGINLVDQINKQMDRGTVEDLKGLLRNNLRAIIASGIPAVVTAKCAIECGTELMISAVGTENLRIVAAMLSALANDVENTPIPVPNDDDDGIDSSLH